MLTCFAIAAAEYLQHDDDCTQHLRADCGDFAECYQTALDNPNDTWNYLWWLGTEDSRAICIKFSNVL